MGASQSEFEKQIQDQDYCGLFGIDESDKKCSVFRNMEAIEKGHLIDRDQPDIHSLYQFFKKQWKNYKNENCLGTKVQIERSGEFEYKWKTYDQIHTETQILANAIQKEGLAYTVSDTDFMLDLQVLGICSVNREEWLVTDLASNLIDVTSVPLYETLGDEMLEIILKQTEMTTLFGSDVCLKNILKLISGKKTNLKQVVTFDKSISDQLKEAADTNKISIISYHDLIEKHRESGYEILDEKKNSLDTVFTISYTSGTSGNSKGVMLSNRNFLSAITNIMQLANQFKFTHDDVYISYLPLAHVFDRLGVHTILSQGGQIGFFGGKILEITQDLQLLKPTIFPSVPRLLNKVYERVMTGVQDLSVTRRFMFFQALVSKTHYNKEYGWTNNQIFDSLVLSKAKERLGGRVRIMITGSAPIAPNVLAFLRCIFCCPIVEAYGQTESCGASFGTKVFDNASGHVGGPGVGVEYKLDDLPEMNYTRDSKPYPAGEICIRGPAIFKGYFRNLQLTRETIDEHGWLRTGDVGCQTEQNKLRIIDRVKNIFKLSQGEYIVPEKLERAYEQSNLIAQIFVHGDSLRNHIVAIIYPDPLEVQKFCNKLELQCGDSHSERIKLVEVIRQIESDLSRIAKDANFNSLEKIKGNFELVDKEFEIGVVLTPTLKLRRKFARDMYQEQIQRIYQKADAAINMQVNQSR